MHFGDLFETNDKDSLGPSDSKRLRGKKDRTTCAKLAVLSGEGKNKRRSRESAPFSSRPRRSLAPLNPITPSKQNRQICRLSMNQRKFVTSALLVDHLPNLPPLCNTITKIEDNVYFGVKVYQTPCVRSEGGVTPYRFMGVTQNRN